MLSEERLRQAAHHAAQALEDSLPPPSQCHYDVSPEFRRNMKKLCRQAKRRPYRTVWKAVACAALVLILGSTSYLGLNAQARDAFFGWVTQITQNVSHYFFSGSSDKHPENYRYVLPEIPEGYTQDVVDEDGGLRSELYVNEQGEYLAFETQYVTEESQYELFTYYGDGEHKKVSVCGADADFYLDETEAKANTLVWKDPETDVLLSLSACMDENQLISLAESVTRQEK